MAGPAVPMTDNLKLAEAFFQRGRFSEALAAARETRARTLAEGQTRDCLICDCQQYAGDHQSSMEEAQAAIDSRTLPAALTARYLGIVGRIRRDQHRREEAAEAFGRAIRAADRSQDLALLASLQQLWLITVGEADTQLELSVRNAYRTAARSGDPLALAGFHVRLIQLEGQRGAFETALHHASLAESLLKRSEHLALHGILEVNHSCVLGLMGAFGPARKRAEAGARLAGEAGYLRLAMAAGIDVAHNAIASGELTVAESWLRHSLALMNRLQIVDGNLLENLACIDLLKGRPDAAKLHLSRALRPVDDPKWTADGEGYTLLTELYFHKQQHSDIERERVIKQLKAICGSQGDRHLEALTALAEIELLFDKKQFGEANRLLAEGLNQFSSVVYWSEFNRIASRSLWIAGHRLGARRRLARASSVADVRGSRLAWVDALREQTTSGPLQKADIAYSIRDQVKQATSKFPALMNTPSPTWYEQVLPGVPERPRDDVDGFDDAIGILELAGEPELRGREALASILSLAAARHGALVSHGSSGLKVLAAAGWTREAVVAALKSPGCIRLPVRDHGTVHLELVLEPSDFVRSRLVIAGVRRLLDAAKALDSTKKDQQRLGALWQPEVIIEEPDAVFSSPQMIELMQTARKVAVTSLPVLLMGETGTGKEVVARAIHRASSRANKIFLPFNCSALPRDMIESQLFGYRRGSFTGAHNDFPGIIRSAEGGTLFLDEIGELSLDLQPKLLRFLETNEVHPLGEGKPIKVDVRVIAATNADLDDLIEKKEFREDLYYRLNIVRFQMPQLAERREEIPPLVMHLLRRFEMDEKKHSIKISDELMEYLLLYKWPGNVRQLSNELRKMVAMVGSGETLTPDHLSPAIRATRRTVPVDPDAEPPPAPEPPPADPESMVLKLDQPLHDAVETLERAMIERAIARTDGRMEEAARLLGISRKGLFLKRRRWHAGGGDTTPPEA